MIGQEPSSPLVAGIVGLGNVSRFDRKDDIIAHTTALVTDAVGIDHG